MKKVMLLFAFLVLAGTANAQQVAIKNNVLYDAALTPNLGLEIGLSKRLTLDISGNYNWFKLNDGKMWKHWLVQPELRFWTCERFNGNFVGIHGLGGEYNFANFKMPFGLAKGLRDHRYEGYYYGAGLSYGHQWILSKRWSMELSIGAGYVRYYYEKRACEDCSPLLDSGHGNYWGPTKAALTFLFFL